MSCVSKSGGVCQWVVEEVKGLWRTSFVVVPKGGWTLFVVFA